MCIGLVGLCVYICIHTHIYMYTYIHTYIYIYTHTHTHTYIKWNSLNILNSLTASLMASLVAQW